MNRIYKVIWSKVKNCYVVTSELAKSHTKGCSGKRAGRILAAGAVVAGLMLPMGEADAFSSSYVNYNNSGSGPDYMTDGGHTTISNINGYDPTTGSYWYSVYYNDDGTVEFHKTENAYRQDISSYIGNVAIGNFAEAGTASDVTTLNINSGMVYYETKPTTGGTWYSTTHDGKTYWYNYTYVYGPSNGQGYVTLEKDGKYYHGKYVPQFDNEGNPVIDDNGNMVGAYQYAEISQNIWKKDPNNPNSTGLVVDYLNVDENGDPVYELTAEELGLDPNNPFSYSGGTNNVAVGNKAKTISHSSVAVGDTSTARGYRSVAIGAEAEAGQENAGGDWNNGTSAVAIGDSAKAYGGTSVAVGSHAQTYSFSGVAVGNNSNASTEYAIAIGDNARVAYVNGADDDETKKIAVHGIAIGRDTLVEGKDGTAVGRQSQALMRNATAYGNNAHADAFNSVAIGNKAIAGSQEDTSLGQSAVAVGNRATALDEYTTAIGASTFAKGTHSVAVGDSNRATGAYSTAIGAGWSTYTVDEDDNDNTEKGREYDSIGANQATGDYSTSVGYGNATLGLNSTAVGMQNAVSGKDSLAYGSQNKVGTDRNPGKTTLQDDASTVGDVTGYAIGSYNEITGNKSLAVGTENKVSGKQSIAIGTGHEITGNNSGAIGDPDIVNADDSYVVGNNSTIDKGANGSFVIGNDASATVEKSVALGSESHAYRDAKNGGAGAGFDVTTGKNYKGDGSDSPTWLSTLGAVSVGGKEDDTDAEIGTAATATRQITGVAAGTADTDAVNVAQLKLAVAGTTYTAGDNIEITDDNVINATNTTYTADQSVDAGDDWGKGSTKFTITDSDGKDLKPMTVKAGKNIKITEGDNGEAVIEGNGLKSGEYKVEYDDNGNGSVTIEDEAGNKATITNIQSGGDAATINRLGDRINRMDSKIDKVGAGAAALAGLHPLDFDPDEKWHVAAGIGNYGSETAVAIGAFYQPTDDILYNIATTVGDGRNMVSGGVSIRFGQKSHQSRSKKAMAKEIIELREEVAELKALVYDLTGKGGLDPSKTAVFPDTPENHWAYDYVAVLAGNGVLEGYQDGYFKGNRQLTRYEMAAIIYRLMSKGIEVDSRMLQEFAPELARVKVDTLTHYNDGTPHIQRVRIIPQRG